MFNFLIGIAIGWLAGSWYSNNGFRPMKLQDGRGRASSAVEESQRLVEESRRELHAILGTGERNKRRSSRRSHEEGE